MRSPAFIYENSSPLRVYIFFFEFILFPIHVTSRHVMLRHRSPATPLFKMKYCFPICILQWRLLLPKHLSIQSYDDDGQPPQPVKSAFVSTVTPLLLGISTRHQQMQQQQQQQHQASLATPAGSTSGATSSSSSSTGAGASSLSSKTSLKMSMQVSAAVSDLREAFAVAEASTPGFTG